MNWLIYLSIAFVLIMVYALYVRPWLLTKPWAEGFFSAIEPFERRVFKKSETVLLARAKQLIGVLLTVLLQTNEIDVNAILPLVPDAYDSTVVILFKFAPMFITVLGMADERLRNGTTKPLEIVALPEAELAKPEVAKAVQRVEAANEVAVDVAAKAAT